MKVLFFTYQIRDDQLHINSKADYMSDLLFHGMRSILGNECVDYPKKHYMYKNYGDASGLWGKGFTYSKILEDIEVDREEVGEKLVADYYDLVIFSIHHSLQFQYEWCKNQLGVLRNSTKSPIAVVDGHDWPKYNQDYFNYTDLFFKREIDNSCDSRLKPIWFAIPKEKITKSLSNENRHKDFANIYPADSESPLRSTHSYNTEDEYYNDYKTSLYAFTSKKGGWDCMRHCEILANGCIPIFTDIENCPDKTLYRLPKKEFSRAKNYLGLTLAKTTISNTYTFKEICPGSVVNKNFKPEDYLEQQDYLYNYTKHNLTTENLAKYIFGEVL